MKDTHALDALLHANAPIPLPEVRKLIIEALNREREEFLLDLNYIWNNTTFFNDNDMSAFQEKQEKWEQKLAESGQEE